MWIEVVAILQYSAANKTIQPRYARKNAPPLVLRTTFPPAGALVRWTYHWYKAPLGANEDLRLDAYLKNFSKRGSKL